MGTDPGAARQPSLRTRLAFAAVSSAALAAALAAMLLAPPDRSPTPTPFVADAPLADHEPVPLEERGNGRARRLLTLHLTAVDPAALATHDEIRLWTATYRDRSRLVRGILRLRGSDCSWVTPVWERLRDNQLLTFRRATECTVNKRSEPGELLLELTLAGRGRAAVWAVDRAAVPDAPAPLRIGGLAIEGSVADDPPPTTMRRIDLLAAMWRIADGPFWIWLAVLCASILSFLGLLLLPARPRPTDATRTEHWRFGAASVLGAACLTLAIATLHAVLNPPLTGPDEPRHLGAMLKLIGGDDRIDEIREWASVTHLQRIRFHTDERFRPIDVLRPSVRSFSPTLLPTIVGDRSPTTEYWWRRIGNVVYQNDVETTLLLTRLANACLFAFAVAIGVTILISTTAVPFPQASVFPFAIVPTLPFFATHVSETAVLAAIYVVLAAIAIALIHGGPRTYLLGLPLGLVAVTVIAAGRQGWPMACFVIALVTSRALLSDQGERPFVARSALFWAGVALGISVGSTLLDAQFLKAFSFRVDRGLGTHLGSVTRRVIESPWMAWVGAVAGSSLELAVRRRRRARRVEESPEAAEAWRKTARCCAAFVPLTILVSLFIQLPTTPAIQVPHEPELLADAPSLSAYVGRTVLAGVTMFRADDSDFLLSTSFWGEFGWLDTPMPHWLTSGSVIATGASFSCLLLILARHKKRTALLRLAVATVGWIGTLATYAAATYLVPVNLHGRYLIGWHLLAITIAWSFLLLHWRVSDRWQLATDAAVWRWSLLVVPVAAQVAALASVLARYY